MRRIGMSQAEIVAALLRANANRCAPPLPEPEIERIAKSIARYEPDQIAVAVAENHWQQMHREPSEEPSIISDPGPIPERLLYVPGFVGQVMEYTLSTARYCSGDGPISRRGSSAGVGPCGELQNEHGPRA